MSYCYDDVVGINQYKYIFHEYILIEIANESVIYIDSNFTNYDKLLATFSNKIQLKTNC